MGLDDATGLDATQLLAGCRLADADTLAQSGNTLAGMGYQGA